MSSHDQDLQNLVRAEKWKIKIEKEMLDIRAKDIRQDKDPAGSLRRFQKYDRRFRNTIELIQLTDPGIVPDFENRLRQLQRFIISLRDQVRRYQYFVDGQFCFHLPIAAQSRLVHRPLDFTDRRYCAARILCLLEQQRSGRPYDPDTVFQDMRVDQGIGGFVDMDALPEEFHFLFGSRKNRDVTLDLDLFMMLVADTMAIRIRSEEYWLNYPWRAHCRRQELYYPDPMDVLKHASEEAHEGDCIICMEPFSAELEDPMVTKCGHVVGSNCLETWASDLEIYSQRCPMCRTPLFEPLDKVPTSMRGPAKRVIANRARLVRLDEDINTILLHGKRNTYTRSFGDLVHDLEAIYQEHTAAYQDMADQWQAYCVRNGITDFPGPMGEAEGNMEDADWYENFGFPDLDTFGGEVLDEFEEEYWEDEEYDENLGYMNDDMHDVEMVDAFAEPETEDEHDEGADDPDWVPGTSEDDTELESVPTRFVPIPRRR